MLDTTLIDENLSFAHQYSDEQYDALIEQGRYLDALQYAEKTSLNHLLHCFLKQAKDSYKTY